MYSRFKALQNYSSEELEQLQSSTVAVVGLGATGSVISEHLARHGVKLVIIDRDYLEPNDVYSSNIYTPEQCENVLPKAKAAEEHLSQFTEVKAHQKNLNPENTSILEDCDLIIDGTDNLRTRFLIAEYSRREEKPWIYTAAIGTEGYSMFFEQECFNCIFEDVNAGSLDTCETAGIMREVSTMAASESAKKAVEYLTDQKMDEKLDMIHNGESFRVESKGCQICEEDRYPHLNEAKQTSSVCGENKYHVELDEKPDIESVGEKLDILEKNDYLVRVEVEGRKITVFNSGRAIVEAQDEGHAEQLVAEVLGL